MGGVGCVRWPSAVSINLWPYALRNANDLRNDLPDNNDGPSPLERFSSSSVSPSLRDRHTLFCPVYVKQPGKLPSGTREPDLASTLAGRQGITRPSGLYSAWTRDYVRRSSTSIMTISSSRCTKNNLHQHPCGNVSRVSLNKSQ